MTQENKELLLKDLCARLPYGVVVKDRNGVHILTSGNTEFIDLFNGKCNIKPYLFPLSSMTEEQKIIYGDLCYAIIHSLAWDTQAALNELVDWLNENHFDYNNLIPMGLANDCTNLNIY